jgi:hypothetical protein
MHHKSGILGLDVQGDLVFGPVFLDLGSTASHPLCLRKLCPRLSILERAHLGEGVLVI